MYIAIIYFIIVPNKEPEMIYCAKILLLFLANKATATEMASKFAMKIQRAHLILVSSYPS